MSNGMKHGKPLSRRDYYIGCALQACIQKFDIGSEINDAKADRIVNQAVAIGGRAADVMDKIDSVDDVKPTESVA